MTLTVGSLFSGVGGFEMGFERAGFDVRWQCEIDPDATSVLERHWPNVRRYRDVTEVDPADLEPVDVITFGSPCQGFSVAGKRGGLEDDRSGLFAEAVRIIRGVRPAVAVWENVPGSFTTGTGDDPDDVVRGRDFAAVLAALANCGALDIGWRVLDSLGVGDCDLHRDGSGRWAVPQRRRRIFLVADFGGRRAAEILSLGEGVSRHPQARRKTREAAAARAGRGTAPGGRVVAAFGGNNRSGPIDAAATLLADGQRGDFESETFVVAVDARNCEETGDVTLPLEAGASRSYNCQPLIVEETRALYFEPLVARNGRGAPDEIASALKAEAGTTGKGDAAPHVLIAAQAFDWQKGGGGNDTSWRGKSREWVERAGDYAGALGSSKHDAVALAWQESQSGTRERGDAYGTLDANYGPRRHEGLLIGDGLRYVIRRLTPREAERLQGWPDDHTRWRADGREIADGPRYRMIGNGVAANVAEWIARRLRTALEAV